MRGDSIARRSELCRQLRVQFLDEFMAILGRLAGPEGKRPASCRSPNTFFCRLARRQNCLRCNRICRRLTFEDSSLPLAISDSLPTPLSKHRTPMRRTLHGCPLPSRSMTAQPTDCTPKSIPRRYGVRCELPILALPPIDGSFRMCYGIGSVSERRLSLLVTVSGLLSAQGSARKSILERPSAPAIFRGLLI